MLGLPTWFVWVFNLLGLGFIILVLVLVMAWRNAENVEGKLIAEIWEPNGFTPRHLVKYDQNGATVTVDNIVYRLPREVSTGDYDKHDKDEGKGHHAYPRRRWAMYPSKPPFGLKFLRTPIRIESWERDNPEPIRPFYGRITEDGRFEDSQLTVTGSEWQAQKSVIQATGIAMSVQEREAREKEWAKAMANLPDKFILYLLVGISALGSVVSVILTWQLAGLVPGG